MENKAEALTDATSEAESLWGQLRQAIEFIRLKSELVDKLQVPSLLLFYEQQA